MENMKSKLDKLDPAGIAFGGLRWAATLCYDTNMDSVMGIHNSFIAVFQDIMQRTGNPAVAVQSLLTMATANAYVELQPYFDFELPAQYSVWSRASIPTRWTSFILVASVVAVHTATIAVVVAMFRRQTRYTELGNSWQPVAQSVSLGWEQGGGGNSSPRELCEAARVSKGEMERRIDESERNIRYRIAKEGNSPHPAMV